MDGIFGLRVSGMRVVYGLLLVPHECEYRVVHLHVDLGYLENELAWISSLRLVVSFGSSQTVFVVEARWW